MQINSTKKWEGGADGTKWSCLSCLVSGGSPPTVMGLRGGPGADRVEQSCDAGLNLHRHPSGIWRLTPRPVLDAGHAIQPGQT
eukprot:CAMPEP_0174331488 /NCGR_PEP_ID=MMETSP0810-20121108/17517_1 /TAXON_ID=73025 ORGANISM="Eutreptiella gymnastica-like, Strain CCMP1594" /NCGR_SAMPLE_ID=MMETSP0810 /ASSEMBLY_ACC=CAM_ASM_000659 /LENGTH=82 /DNA_ID=CAMNT_0015447285 /DNA_START=273 /DNA_END=517 /DNA_ORIENTATION=+